MKRIQLLVSFMSFMLLVFVSAQSVAQEQKPKIYHPEANARQEIDAAIKKAKESGKHVFLQLGGNWCGWCILFHDLVQGNEALKTLMNSEYEVLHVNYSPENKNEEVLASLDYPQRFGFPVFVILDGNGKRIHTQNSAYLEEGQGHSVKKVDEFLKSWTKRAVDPTTYQK